MLNEENTDQCWIGVPLCTATTYVAAVKKKLLVVLGAGSSVSHGIPSVQQIDEEMLRWSDKWATSYPTATNFYRAIWDNAKRYYEDTEKPHMGRTVHFEKALRDLYAFANWMKAPPYGETLRSLVTQGDTQPVPAGFHFQSGPRRFLDETLVMIQSAYLLGELAKYMRGACINGPRKDTKWEEYCGLFNALRSEFNVGIYNLNYDTLALNASPGAFTGFGDDGRPNPKQVHGNATWNFVYHLHGSVHQSLSHSAYEYNWLNNLKETFNDGAAGTTPRPLTEDRMLPKTTLIAGGWKLDQLQWEPYQTFYSSLIRHAYEADAILIGGYGFADHHINTAIRNRMLASSNRPPVAVLTRAEANDDPLQIREDIWAKNLTKTLYVDNPNFAENAGSSPTPPVELRKKNAFELNTVTPTAVWYGGFHGAFIRANDLCTWLRAPSSRLK